MTIRQFLHIGSYADASGADDSQPTLDALVCIIPCFNEGLVLGDTLTSVLRTGLRPENVLVVDDCSTDATASIAERFGVGLLRHQHNQGKSKSIRRAIDHVRAGGACAYLSVLDGDTLVDPDYFRSVVRTFEADPDVVLVCGQPRSRRYNWLTAYRAVEYALSHAIYKQAQHKMGVITVAPGCASTYRMTILPHLEWNPHILTEDADTTVQVYRKGLGRVVYDGNAIVHTQDPNTIHALKGQLRRWYTGLWQVVVCHRVPFGRQRLDAEFGLLAGEALLAAARRSATAVDPTPGSAVHFPGSFWMSSGNVSPLEAGNLVTTYAAEQGFTVLKRGPHTVVPYGALTVSTDQQGFDWNNKAVPQVGLRYARAFTRGVVQVGAGYAYERRLRSKTGIGQPIGYASYWFGWTGHLSGRSSRSFWSSLPGTSWASVGNHAPAEGHNVIGSIYIQQGITAARVGKLSLIPFAEHTLTMDSGGQPWNNRRIRGGGSRCASSPAPA